MTLAWWRRRPVLLDVIGLVVVWALFSLGATTPGELERPHGKWIGAAMNVALLAPLLFRRRAPVVVLGVVGALAAFSTLALGTTGGEIALAGALVTVVALEESARRRAAAVGVTLLAALAAVPRLEGDSTTASIAVLVACTVAATAIGTAQRYARALVRARAERAARLVEERRQEAALAVAAERTRIARELHDVVAHSVSVMVRLADGAARSVEVSPDAAREAMTTVAGTGREALAELRSLLGVLHSSGAADLAPTPGLAELPALVERTRAAGLPVTLEVTGEPRPMRPGLQLTVHRLVQEALTNALRHARSPGMVEVRLRWCADALEVVVVDDGGTAVAAGAHGPGEAGEAGASGAVGGPGGSGRGLAGMRQRLAPVGAELVAGPEAGGGWVVSTRVPLGERVGGAGAAGEGSGA